MKSVVSSVVKKFAKPLAKRALESGVSHAGERLGKKISEKSGDLIMKRLANMIKGDTRQKQLYNHHPLNKRKVLI